ncbi:uncharacterized protein B0H18DRAFT_987469 [Fomitopsis serialis]|uniref:uncharacterized protein n=1 Tax=Fomitopsis serialis TaxID=139415 RepID=UPI002008E679|nr:uncharacterized protein B0H18DRAFT_987469 [Neoantrodia serialis]KAH9932298.1 hypothetical protein B0H18DRAFT_987469 [Neoantrodia serialis]
MSVNSRKSRKRARADIDSEDESSAAMAAKEDLKHDDQVWFDDGNVVLVAESIAFCIHRGLLSLHSEVFRGMFTMPPPENEETVAGCPVVRVSDAAQEMRYMLWALYNGRAFRNPRAQVPFKVVAALLRLAHKYQITYLREEALARIKTVYVDDSLDFMTEECPSHPLLTYEEEDAFDVVQLAHLTDTPSLLPAALYLCCETEPFWEPTNIIKSFLSKRDEEPYNLLSQEDVFRCLAARPQLVEARLAVFSYIFSDAGGMQCRASGLCRGALAFIKNRFFEAQSEVPEWPVRIDCLYPRADDVMSDTCYSGQYSFCSSCQTYFKGRDKDIRERIWSDLPSYFGLDIPGWVKH